MAVDSIKQREGELSIALIYLSMAVCVIDNIGSILERKSCLFIAVLFAL
jgi:hypothetical protein